nr:RecName: Full=Unknown protein from spot 688 of 2D-PAGE of etiolated coleoptile [Zea mays]
EREQLRDQVYDAMAE